MRPLVAKIQYVLLYGLLFIMAISYHPYIIDASRAVGMENGTILSRYITILFAALTAVSVLMLPRIKSGFVVRCIVWILVIALFGLLVFALFNNMKLLASMKAFLIVLASILIGISLKPSQKQLYTIVFVFCGTIIFSGLMQVFTNIGGFVIEDQYLTDSKNSLGAMLASAAICFFAMALVRRNSRLRMVFFALGLFCLFIIITIRARAAMLAVVLVSLYMLFFQRKSSSSRQWIVFLLPLLLIVLAIMPFDLIEYLDASISSGTQSTDITSGRMGTYKMALAIFFENPLFGDLKVNTDIPWVHNFPLLYLYQFGLLFSWPVLGFYLYILIHALKVSMRREISFYGMGFTVLLIPYFISLLEPTFPFGPGTVTVFNFILLGIAESALMDSANAS